MQHDPRRLAESLLDDCSLLLRRACAVVKDAPAETLALEELNRVLALVSEASARLGVLTGEVEQRGLGVVSERHVGNIVSRILGRHRGPRGSAIQGSEAPEELLREEEPLSGHSRTVAIPDLLSFLKMQRKTGMLRVVLPAEVITIQFDGGDLASAVSSNSPPGCLLGEILVEQGAIHHKQLEAFLAHYSASDGRLGSALEVVELVTESQLRGALTTQIQRLFHRLLAAGEALFEFRDGQTEETHPETRLDVIRLLLESARWADEAGVRSPGGSHGASDPPPALPSEAEAVLDDLRAEIHARLGPNWSRPG